MSPCRYLHPITRESSRRYSWLNEYLWNFSDSLLDTVSSSSSSQPRIYCISSKAKHPPINRSPKILPMATFNNGCSDEEPDAGFEVLNPSPTASSESCSIHLSPLQKWHNYFQKGTLQDHQRLCVDLGLLGDLPSKTKCRNVSQRMSRT